MKTILVYNDVDADYLLNTGRAQEVSAEASAPKELDVGQTVVDANPVAERQGNEIDMPAGGYAFLPGRGEYTGNLAGATTFSFTLDAPGSFSATDREGHPVPMRATEKHGAQADGNSVTLNLQAGEQSVLLSPLGDGGRIVVFVQ